MGFLCNKKEEEKIVSLTLIEETKLLSDLGLNNIYNVNPSVDFCAEIFRSPEFVVSGAVELVSGLTTNLTGCTTGATAVYNFDYTPDFNISLIITGGTDYTGYTGSLCYKLFDGNRFTDSRVGLTSLTNERLNSCITFSAITSTTINTSFIQGSLPNSWGEYLMRFYYIFTSKECNVGSVFNTWYNTVQINTPQTDDKYFMTVVNPPDPILPLPGGKVLPNYVLVSEKLLYDGVSTQMSFQAINGNLNYWILGGYPLNNEVLLTVNGVTLKQGTSSADGDFRVIDNGWGVPKVIEVYGPIENTSPVKPSDIVVATYINAQPNTWPMNFERYFMDSILVDGFTYDAPDQYRTPGDNTINICTTCAVTMEQMFTTKPINDDYSVKVYVNGVALTEDREYFLSSFDGRINFNPEFVTLKVGDIVAILAYSKYDNGDYDYGTIDSTDFNVEWSINEKLPENVSGYFTVRLYNDETNLLLFQNPIVPYSSDQVNYSSLFTNLSVNVKYKIEVEFKVTYNAKMNNNVSTCSFAYGYFNTNNPKLLYSNP